MSSKIIPKEQLSAYQRWELSSFDEVSQSESEAGMALPTAEEIESIHQQAYQAGHQEGVTAGYQEGRARAEAEAARLAQIISVLDGDLQRFDENLSQTLLSLALDIARQMLREALRVKPELVLPVIREAVNALPQANQHLHLKLHPDDAALVRSLMEDELSHFHWKVIEDSRLERGGCLVETANSEINATVESRWKRVLAALGREGEWLE